MVPALSVIAAGDEWDQHPELGVLIRNGDDDVSVCPVRMPAEVWDDLALPEALHMIGAPDAPPPGLLALWVRFEAWVAPDTLAHHLADAADAGVTIPSLAEVPGRGEARWAVAVDLDGGTHAVWVTRGQDAPVIGHDVSGGDLLEAMRELLGRLTTGWCPWGVAILCEEDARVIAEAAARGVAAESERHGEQVRILRSDGGWMLVWDCPDARAVALGVRLALSPLDDVLSLACGPIPAGMDINEARRLWQP